MADDEVHGDNRVATVRGQQGVDEIAGLHVSLAIPYEAVACGG